jgi:hypothetical protein
MTTPLIPRKANAELVAQAYLREILTPYGVGVAAVLPGPSQETGLLSWAVNGFVVVGSVNDQINRDVPVRTSIVSLDVYAVAVNSGKPPWGQAYAIAEVLIEAQYDTTTHDTQQPITTLPTGFPDVRVCGFRAVTGPSRRPSDPSNFARVGFDVSLSWHPLG